jgi:MraZ protein
MFFVGMFELTVDSKNRLSIPYSIRSKLNPDEDGRSFYVLPGHTPQTLVVYPDRYFERLRGSPPPLEDLSTDACEWRQFEFSQGALLDPDNQGRILIPERLLKRAGIGREVTLIGVQDHMELWGREQYEAFQDRTWPNYPQQRAKAAKELRELAAARSVERSE